MPDLKITKTNAFSDGKPLVERYKDMGDGTYARVTTTVTEANNGVTAGGTPFTAVVGPIVNTTSTALKAAGAAGIKNRLISFTAVNTSAVASAFNILDGATIIWTDYVPANSRVSHTFTATPNTTANTALNVQMATTATSTTFSIAGTQGA